MIQCKRYRQHAVAVGLVLSLAGTASGFKGAPPNVVFFLVDDFPWELWPRVGNSHARALMPNLAKYFVDEAHNHHSPNYKNLPS